MIFIAFDIDRIHEARKQTHLIYYFGFVYVQLV